MPLWGIYLLKFSVKKQLLPNKVFAVLCANNILISCGNKADATLKNISNINKKIIKLVVTGSLEKEMCSFFALLISSWKTRFRTLLSVSPNFSSKLLWTLLPSPWGFWTFSFLKIKKSEWRKEAGLYCMAGQEREGLPGWKGVINGLPSNWWLVTSRAQGSIVRPMLFNIFIDNLDDETEYILSKFKGDTKLGRVVDMLNVRASTQRDLEKLWIKRNILWISKEKGKVLHLGWDNPIQQHHVGTGQL